MKCGTKGIDTAHEIIFEGCNMFYVPNDTGTERPCKHFTMCQKRMKRMIEAEDEPRKLHRKYLEEQKQ